MAPPALHVSPLDPLSFVGLERSHLRSAVYRRVFGGNAEPLRIGRYSILERVGSGARGVVFKAFDNQLDRPVALKVLSTRAGDNAELIREAKALARLSHPNVLSVYEVGETEDGQVFLATEYVKGWTLRGWYDDEHRSEAAIVELMCQVALGVQAAHDEGLVHRDLKPANILVGRDGRVRVADFGLARFDPTALAPGMNVPRDGVATTTAGTPGYMAPELFAGVSASAGSDQYALAVTLRELLCDGQPQASLKRAGRSSAIAAALERGLSEAPEDRFPSVAAFADGLRASKRPRRRARLLLGAGVLLTGVSVSMLLVPGDSPAATNAEVALLKAQAALPNHPARAVEALREIQDSDDDRVLATAEEALALGSETARWSLPKGASQAALLGDMLTYRTPNDGVLRVHGLADRTPTRLDATEVGILDVPPDDNTVFGSTFYAFNIDIGDAPTLLGISPRALRAIDRRQSDLACSKDGSRIVRHRRGSSEIIVEDGSTGEVLWTLDQPTTALSSVSIDEGGHRVAWIESPGKAFVHDLASETTVALETVASAVHFRPGVEDVIVQGRFSGVFEVRLSDGRVTRLFEDDEKYAVVELSPDGAWVAALDQHGGVWAGKLEQWSQQRFDGDGFVFAPDGSRVAAFGGNTVTVHDLETRDAQSVRTPSEVLAVEFASDHVLWVLGTDDNLRRYELDAPRGLRGHTSLITDVSLSQDGSRAVSAGRDYTVRLWDVDAEHGRVVVETGYEPRHVTLDEARDHIAVNRNGGATFVYDLAGEVVAELPQSYARPVVTADGDWLGAGEQGVWRDSGGETTTLASGNCGAVIASERFVAATCGSNPTSVHIWAGGEHHQTTVEDPGYRTSLHAWPDAGHLAVVGMTPTLFEIGSDGALLLQPTPAALVGAHRHAVPAASSNAHDLLINRADGTSSVWGLDSSAVQLTQTGASMPLGLSGDGRRFAYVTEDQTIIVRDRAVSKAHRDLGAVLDAHTVVEGEL